MQTCMSFVGKWVCVTFVLKFKDYENEFEENLIVRKPCNGAV